MHKNKKNKIVIKLTAVFINKTVLRLFLVFVGITLTGMMLTGCGMLPQKEVVNVAPVSKEYEPIDYSMVKVEKGTVALVKEIGCTYTQLKGEDLSFNLTGEIISHIYCSTGDSVKKGDLLAELETENLEEDLNETEYSIGEFILLISQNKELLNLEIKRQQQLSKQSGLSEDDSEEAITTIQKKYNLVIKSIEDSLYLAKVKKTQILNKIENRRLYAGMDGAITYAKEMEGKESTKNEVIIGIVDNSQIAFAASKDSASYFTEGEKVTVNATNSSYETIVHISQKKDDFIYFQLTIPDVNLKDGETGTVHLELEKSENTLYLPVDVVHKAKDYYYVYYIDETGVQNMKTVEVGMKNEDSIEIISGLKYEEAVLDK